MVVLVPDPILATCSTCHSDHVVRFKHTRNGNQRYRCNNYHKTFCCEPSTNAHSEEFKAMVLAAYHERASMRGTCRIFGISPFTTL